MLQFIKMPWRSQDLSLLCRISLRHQHQGPDSDPHNLPSSKSNAQFPEHLFLFPSTYLWMGCYITYKSVVECSTFSASCAAKWWHDCCKENYAVHDLKYLAFEMKLKEEESRLWYLSFLTLYIQDRNTSQQRLQKMSYIHFRQKIYTSKTLKLGVLNLERNNYNESPRH